MKISRRNFLKTSAITGAFLPFTSAFPSEAETKTINNHRPRIYFFTKDLDGYETEFMTETLAMSGVDGMDLTVRRNGKVEPSRVTQELPEVIETGNRYNLATHLIVSGILGADGEYTEDVIATASRYGVKHYRLGYYDYHPDIEILESLDQIKGRLSDLSAMNRQYNIQAGYQNHSGARVGSAGWDVWEIIKDFPVQTISSQFDVRHATVEGNRSWKFIMRLLAKNIGSLAIKDFTWQVENRRARIINVPLGEGLVNFDMYARIIKEMEIDVPITLHVEYPLLTPQQENLPLLQKQKIMTEVIKKDVQFIHDLLS